MLFSCCISNARISRSEPLRYSCVHFFTTHFFSTLKNEGVDAVCNWTTKKGIDIFAKRMIMLPINQSLHWSLCAVVNPGLIVNYGKILEQSGSVSQMKNIVSIDYCMYTYFQNEHLSSSENNCKACNETLDVEKTEVPCIIFLDSLLAHQENVVASYVRQWLNHEWKIVKKTNFDLFTTQSIKLVSPKGILIFLLCSNMYLLLLLLLLIFASNTLIATTFCQYRTKTTVGIAGYLFANTHFHYTNCDTNKLPTVTYKQQIRWKTL